MAKKSISTNKTEVFLIKTNSKTVLSKDQITFNNLSKTIETLRKQVVKKALEAEYKLDFYYKQNLSIETEETETKTAFIKFLFKLSQVEKLSKKQQTQIEKCIALLMKEVAGGQFIDDDLKEIYNFYTKSNFDDELAEDLAEAKSMLEDQLKRELGIEIDLSGFDFTDPSPENHAKIQALIQEAIQAQHGEDSFNNSKYEKADKQAKEKSQKKTKAELKQEELETQKEELKNKSIRSIYLALAKILHPDLETDIDKKLEKEELMKQVIIAYDNKDLTTLLKLEIQWIQNENHSDLSAQKLKVYIEVLREQVTELKSQKYNIYRHQRFQPIYNYQWLNKARFETTILRQTEYVKEEIELIKESIFELEDFKIYKASLFKTIELLNFKPMTFEDMYEEVFGSY